MKLELEELSASMNGMQLEIEHGLELMISILTDSQETMVSHTTTLLETDTTRSGFTDTQRRFHLLSSKAIRSI